LRVGEGVKGATRALKLKDGRPMTNQDRLWSGREVVTKARERPDWEERPCTDRSSIREGRSAEACLASRDARRTLRLRTNANAHPLESANLDVRVYNHCQSPASPPAASVYNTDKRGRHPATRSTHSSFAPSYTNPCTCSPLSSCALIMSGRASSTCVCAQTCSSTRRRSRAEEGRASSSDLWAL